MFRFKLVSVTGVKVDEDVHEVILPTMDGEIGVLQDHMPLVSVAKAGAIRVRKKSSDSEDTREVYATNGGAIEVSNNTLTVLVDEADQADEINETETEKALERANKMKEEAKDQVSLDHAQQLVDRYAVRLQVANLRKRHHR